MNAVYYTMLSLTRFKIVSTFLFLYVSLSCDPFRTGFEPREEALLYTSKSIQHSIKSTGDTIGVMTWNIKYGGGRLRFFWECGGTRYSMNETEVHQNLQRIVHKIREIDPDILLLQEADIESKRSAYIDQVQYILDNTNLNYGAYASI